MKYLCTLFLIACTMSSCKETAKETETVTTVEEVEELTTTTDSEVKEFEIIPIEHASTILNWDGRTVYVDPVGKPELYKGYKKPDLIVITHLHGDHLNVKTLEGLDTSTARIVVPQSVAEKMPEAFSSKLDILNNGEKIETLGITTNAVPMYNLGPVEERRHKKGWGNGYVLEKDGKRVYFSGDTEDIPEMRNLQDIDIAFVCMNLPYTMTVESAASAVLDFKPTQVYPFHYRGSDGLSDVATFKSIVNKGSDAIEVVQLDWYPNRD
jgi:L-ascorbate metabolism protein UlaG (beta-lactamase superfamily)